MNWRLISTLALITLAFSSRAQMTTNSARLTAFALVKEGNQYLLARDKNRVTEIRSEISSNGLTPDVWYIDFFDSTTAFKSTEVKFVSGKVVGVTHPKHVLTAFQGNKQMEWKRMKIDSDRALSIALKEPELKNLDIQAVQFSLDREALGSTWKIRFWTPRLGKPGQASPIGEIHISGVSGEIFKKKFRF